jgi:hypothetical protein
MFGAPWVRWLLPIVAGTVAVGCRRTNHSHVSSFTPPPLPAGFVTVSAPGWRIAIPSTWKADNVRRRGVYAATDPQSVDDFHAAVNVYTEPFVRDSYAYARAGEVGLRSRPNVAIDVEREELVDGDPTLVIESRWTPTPSSSVAYRTMQVSLASRGVGTVATCAAATNAFERYRSTCESIVRSLAVER